MKGLYLVVPVWGERDTDRWLRYGLPSLLAPGNLPALAKVVPVKMLLCTTREDIPRLFGAPLVKALRDTMPVRALPMWEGPPAADRTREALNACYNQGLTAARQDDFGLIPGRPEMVYADGALAEVARQIAAGRRAVLTQCPTVIADAFEGLLAGAAAEIARTEGSLAIPPRTLARLAMRGLHAMTRSQCWDSDRFSLHPAMPSWPLGEHGLLIRTWHPYPAFLYPDRAAKVTTTIDSTFLDEAISDLGTCAMADDSDRYAAVLLADREQAEFIPTWPRTADPAEIAMWLPRNAKPFNRDMIRHKFWFHDGIDRQDWREVETASDRAVAAILDRFAYSQGSLGFVQKIAAELQQNLIDANSSPWWQQCQANVLVCARDAASPREFLYRIQDNYISGFDHRVERAACDEVEALSRYKWALLARMFPGFEGRLGGFAESPHALPSSLVDIAGRRVSNIFLSHLEFFLFITKFRQPKTILEIGGGYGSLARIFCKLAPPATYVMVDMPTSLLCAYIYLREALPEADVQLGGPPPGAPTPDGRTRVVLIPTTQASAATLAGYGFDLAINTGSFQEMPADTCRRFQDLILEELKVPLVYSNNYFLNANEVGSERERNQAAMPMVPNFPRDYAVAAAVINNPVFDIDACDRNWLEVLLARQPGFAREPEGDGERRLFAAITAICGKHELSLLSYLRAYAFITRFYFGGVLTAPFGWGDSIRSNLYGAKFAFPDDLGDPAAVRSWLNAQLAEIGSLRRRLRPTSDREAQRVDKIETWLVSRGLDLYRTVATERMKRRGLPSITEARLAEFRRVMDRAGGGS